MKAVLRAKKIKTVKIKLLTGTTVTAENSS